MMSTGYQTSDDFADAELHAAWRTAAGGIRALARGQGDASLAEIVRASVSRTVIGAFDGLRATRGRRGAARLDTQATFVFADLTGYTALTEDRGDLEAAELADEFRRTMRGLSRQHGGWQIKSMGDGVMIWVPDPTQAIALARRAVMRVGSRRDLLPVRVGVHTGSAVMRGWDWYGSAVNVAARLADQAGPNEALISAATRAAARHELTRTLESRQELVLRGVARPVVAWCLG
jgi:adenylate cyclase